MVKTTWALSLALAGLGAVVPNAARAQDCPRPDVLVLLDISSTMGSVTEVDSRLNQALNALSDVLQNTQSQVRYGLMLFPPLGYYPVYCAGPDDFAPDVTLALDNWETIYNYLSPTLYGSSDSNPYFDSRLADSRDDYDRPIYQALRSALHLPDLSTSERRHYVVLITDGFQDCSRGGDYDADVDTIEETRNELSQMVGELWWAGIDTFVVGLGPDVDALSLDELANAGHTSPEGCYFDCYYQADDQAMLTAALQSIAAATTTEVCDGFDNDCDGTVDEHEEADIFCESLCGSGRRICQADGSLAPCDAQAPAAAETCGDGLDNDCNGLIDDGCTCSEGAKQNCSKNVGACKQGIETCVRLANGDTGWGPCSGVLPSTEVCDAGLVDEDCDGLVNEGCECVNATTRRCGANIGICRLGTQTCTDGKWGGCAGGVLPAANDACDGLDNDCDGTVDEFCACVTGSHRACGVAVGACRQGEQACVSGRWGDCTGGIAPAKEVCDNVDNDCDGQVDNAALCQGGLICRCGACVGACGPDNTCPTTDSRCTNGYCLFASCPVGSYCDGQLCQVGEDPNAPKPSKGGVHAAKGCSALSASLLASALALVALRRVGARRRQ
jgi:hypothetical protein